ncbi:MAG: membrane protein insertase YidC [Lewinellaceae bacterium]|nr:membrane protein insertase YidC [Lewinellaceae bacterium]
MEEKQNNLNTVIGLGLIFLLLYLWMQYTAPEKKDLPATTPTTQDTAQTDNPAPAETAPTATIAAMPDSAKTGMLMAKYGAFAPAAQGKEETVTLENQFMVLTFTSKGARIKEVRLKKFEKVNTDSLSNDIKSPLRLLANPKNRFEFQIPVMNTASGFVNTRDLYFTAQKSGNTVVFKANTTNGGSFEERYTLNPDNYDLDYQIAFNQLGDVIPKDQVMELDWVNHLDKLERNQKYERTMSSVYFKPTNENSDYCNCTNDAIEKLGDQPVQWFAHSNQFFNTALVAKNFAFTDFVGETKVMTDQDPDLKLLTTTAALPIKDPNGGKLEMMLYSGPNEFDRLRHYDLALEDIIPFGSSIFGTINRWVIHPIFEFLSRFISSPGIVILVLTLIVKLLVYPLTYKMVHSQAKMAALKPKMEELKKKHGDDQQQISVETMKMYSEFGVNPLGGCLPIFLQMPIWFALYRFFPAAIEFRQASFLWATDLSSYDVAFRLPYMLPGFGNHISAFTLIWVVTTLWYTWYNMKQMDTGANAAMNNPAMKYMQYFMPVMFMFFFNSFASGLTTYLCFSNILNIGQTVVTKQYFINHDKIRDKLEANKAKPKKSGGWRERFESAMKEQQRVQAEKNKKK